MRTGRAFLRILAGTTRSHQIRARAAESSAGSRLGYARAIRVEIPSIPPRLRLLIPPSLAPAALQTNPIRAAVGTCGADGLVSILENAACPTKSREVRVVVVGSFMANDKKLSKRELRLARKAQEQQAAQTAERRAARRRISLIAAPLLTVAIALGLYQSTYTRSAAGLTLLGGFLIWLVLALGAVGGKVSARDRGGAGAIDYGKGR